MTKSTVINVSGKEIIVRELSVATARQVIQPNPAEDFIGDTLFADIRLCDLEHLTSLTMEDIDTMLPSELRVVIDACKEKNPDFFEMLDRCLSPPAKR